MVAIAQLVESWIVIPVVVGSSPISHPKLKTCNLFLVYAKMAELVDALASGAGILMDVRVQVPLFAS